MNIATVSPSAPPKCLSVVVGFGFTDNDDDDAAFDHAARIAQRAARSELHIVHVFDAKPSDAESQRLLDGLRVYVNEKASTMESPQGITAGIHLRWGEVVREIFRLATEVRADFIVLGPSHGLHLKRGLGASTAERLLVVTPCPVLVARPGSKVARRQVPPREEPARPDSPLHGHVTVSSGDTTTGQADKSGLRRIAHELEGGASGAIAGAVIGASAGPPGAVAGAILGGVAGVMAGAVLDSESARRSAHASELDAEIGVVGGEIGAPNLQHPPERNRQ